MNYGNPFLQGMNTCTRNKKKEGGKMQMPRTASWLSLSTENPLTLLSYATQIYKSYLLQENPNDIAQNILH